MPPTSVTMHALKLAVVVPVLAPVLAALLAELLLFELGLLPQPLSSRALAASVASATAVTLRRNLITFTSSGRGAGRVGPAQSCSDVRGREPP